jgi:hypothetical protein
VSPELELLLGELRGRVAALEDRLGRLEDRPSSAPAEHDRFGGVKTAITFVAAVVVPVLVALLGGWFALRSAGLK